MRNYLWGTAGPRFGHDIEASIPIPKVRYDVIDGFNTILRFKLEEASNKHLHALAVVTMMLLPPTLVTGIFGMNTKGLPFTDLETAFLWASLLMVVSSLAAYFIMKRIGIIR